jgi:hypothetical protein
MWNCSVDLLRKIVIFEPGIAFPEKHFSFSTNMMVLAIELYQDEAPRDFCHYTTFAYRKLKQFVDDRKEMTTQSVLSILC